MAWSLDGASSCTVEYDCMRRMSATRWLSSGAPPTRPLQTRNLSGPADVVVALTQDHLTSEVHRGENRGRSLAHSAVVRRLTAVGSLKPSVRTFEATATVLIAADWNLADVRIIGLLQERRSRRIVGAGSVRVNGQKGPPSAG